MQGFFSQEITDHKIRMIWGALGGTIPTLLSLSQHQGMPALNLEFLLAECTRSIAWIALGAFAAIIVQEVRTLRGIILVGMAGPSVLSNVGTAFSNYFDSVGKLEPLPREFVILAGDSGLHLTHHLAEANGASKHDNFILHADLPQIDLPLQQQRHFSTCSEIPAMRFPDGLIRGLFSLGPPERRVFLVAGRFSKDNEEMASTAITLLEEAFDGRDLDLTAIKIQRPFEGSSPHDWYILIRGEIAPQDIKQPKFIADKVRPFILRSPKKVVSVSNMVKSVMTEPLKGDLGMHCTSDQRLDGQAKSDRAPSDQNMTADTKTPSRGSA